MKLPFKKLSPEAKMPTKGSDGAAGYDLYANEYVVVSSEYGGRKRWNTVKTGRRIAGGPTVRHKGGTIPLYIFCHTEA